MDGKRVEDIVIVIKTTLRYQFGGDWAYNVRGEGILNLTLSPLSALQRSFIPRFFVTFVFVLHR